MSDEEERRRALTNLRGLVPWLVQLGLRHAWLWFRELETEDRMKVVAELIRYLLTLGYLDGYTLYFAGAASIFSGFSLVLLAIAGDPRGNIEEGLAAIIAGIALIGGAKKADKAIQTQRVVAKVMAASTTGDRELALAQLPPKPKLLPAEDGGVR